MLQGAYDVKQKRKNAIIMQGRGTLLMFQNPLKKVLPIRFAGSNRKDYVNQFLLFIVRHNTVEFKKNQHDVSTASLISIHKRMVSDESKSKLCCFALHRWVNRFTVKCLEWCSQCRFHHPPRREHHRCRRMSQLTKNAGEGPDVSIAFSFSQLIISLLVFAD